MTREEAIEWNKNLRMYMKLSDKNQPCKFLEENYIALDMAIEALEQEPTDGVQRTSNANKKHVENTLEDAISRQAAIDGLCCNCEVYRRNGECTCLSKCEEYHFLATIPPVTVQEKTGRWIEHEHNGIAHIECSKCLTWFLRPHLLRNSYCPNCGAKMEKDGE